jgi:hypothetical protein
MDSGEIRRAVRAAGALLLMFAIASCSGDDDGEGGESPLGGGAGSGAGVPSARAADGTTFWNNDFPVFPGAGTSEEASEPLPDGMVCDVVPGADVLIPDPIRQCFFDKNDPLQLHPAATLEQVLECAEEGDAVHLRLTFHPSFVDNTYGANAIGWGDDAADPAPVMMDGMMMKKKKGKGGHTFRDLVGSDHAEIIVKDGNDNVVVHFKLDYLSEDPTASSGYGSLGVLGGEGEMIVGDPADIVAYMTSMDRNMNERGYASYTVDSPETDALYTPNPATPEWDYRVVYEAWIDADAFGNAGFGGALIEFVHASPSKADSNTLEVEPGDCPPPPDECGDSDPDEDCGAGGVGGPPDEDDPPPPPDECGDSDPDEDCGQGGVGGPPPDEAGSGGSGGSGGSSGEGGPNGGDPEFCQEHPDDPSCEVD